MINPPQYHAQRVRELVKDNYMKVGDRVLINRRDIAPLKHRMHTPIYGWITRIDGAYIDVRPAWCKWTIELYRNEITLATDA